MKYVSREQLTDALRQLAAFRSTAKKQYAPHLLGFLALRRKNVGPAGYNPYAERDDQEFFDEFMRVADDDNPYFDPIKGFLRIKTHPHSNVSTARQRTFRAQWHAASVQQDAQGAETWKLEANYLDILKTKTLTKSGVLRKAPAIPLATFMFRHRPLPDDADIGDLGSEFRTTFNLTDEEYQELFEEGTRPAGAFADNALNSEDVRAILQESGVVAEKREAIETFQELAIDPEKDDILLEVRRLLDDDGYGGVIFVGPPGTGKSWYANQVALALADGNADRIRKIQFHRSFQYEHFVEGFVPTNKGTGFELRKQLMLQVMEKAEADPKGTFVILIDELSRSDPGRVFGELLTYMEPSRRDEKFILASGNEASMPDNIVFIATMNSRDKSVLEIDDAFDRRMAKIDFQPSATMLAEFLRENQVPDEFARRIVGFFNWIQPKYPIGHTFFRGVTDTDSLRRLWRTQLRFVFDKQFKYEPATLAEIGVQFANITGVDVP
jgi:hypothetical protein